MPNSGYLLEDVIEHMLVNQQTGLDIQWLYYSATRPSK